MVREHRQHRLLVHDGWSLLRRNLGRNHGHIRRGHLPPQHPEDLCSCHHRHGRPYRLQRHRRPNDPMKKTLDRALNRARDEQGIAMIMAVIILFVLLGLGAALMMTAGSQQRAASNQQSTETAYSLAEAALNAQIYELATKWPTSKDGPSSTGPTYGYPYSCNAASNGTS